MAIEWINKGALHLALAGRHAAWADVFFRYFTMVGAYGIYIAAATALCCKKWRWAVGLLVSEALSGITCQIIKHLVGAPRPLTWFAENMPEVTLPLVEGQKMAYWNSFPSGHTASFFVLCYWLCCAVRRTSRTSLTSSTSRSSSTSLIVQALCVLMAVTGAYSRIYLQMHFAEDVVVGAIIGTVAAMIGMRISERMGALRSTGQTIPDR